MTTEPSGSHAATKVFRDGTHRTVSPAETVERVRRFMGPMGITRVANVTGLDCIGIPVVTVCRPNARSLAMAQGKGLSLDAAKASGLMESVELYHAERITHPLKLASWNELRFSHAVADVETLPRISVSQFHPDRSLLWIQGLDLLNQRPTWLPYETVHTNYTLPFPTGSGCFVMSSNGLASGNHPLEAINHALCELIERDAASLWRLLPEAEQDARRLDLSTVDDPENRRLLDAYERAGVLVGVWDITSDVGIAAYSCVILDRDPSPFRVIGPVEGMGCHPAREIALARALTEAAQGRLTLIAGSRDDNGRARYEQVRGGSLVLRARSRLNQKGSRAFHGTPTSLQPSLEGDLQLLLESLNRAGVPQVLLVDLTKPEFGVPVVRAVVPGLETYHHVQGYVPGARAKKVLNSRRREDE